MNKLITVCLVMMMTGVASATLVTLQFDKVLSTAFEMTADPALSNIDDIFHVDIISNLTINTVISSNYSCGSFVFNSDQIGWHTYARENQLFAHDIDLSGLMSNWSLNNSSEWSFSHNNDVAGYNFNTTVPVSATMALRDRGLLSFVSK
jgi:hypothetical protein